MNGSAVNHAWQVVTAHSHPAAGVLAAGPAAAGPLTATAVLLGTEFEPGDNALLLRGINDARRHRRRIVLIHLGAGGASLLRAAMTEDRALSGLSIELPPRPSAQAVRVAVALAGSARTSLDEVRVDGAGHVVATRWLPVDLRPAPPPRPAVESVVITGGLGGLGIRAAAVLACRHNLHPVLLDRRTPDRLCATSRRYLRRLAEGPTGVSVRTADVTVPGQVRAALSGVPGPVTTVLHGAGVLTAGPVDRCRPEDLAAAQRVKVAGLRHVLTAVDAEALRNLVLFGSVLADRDPHGLGCYALANELLRRAAQRVGPGLPHAATVVAQWSIWSGAGMAHDLGVVAQARRMGLTPIALRPGMAALRRLLVRPPVPGRTAVLTLLGADRNG